MKKLILAFAAILTCSLSASAISITILEHTPARLDFSIVWGSIQDLTPADLSTPGVVSINASETIVPPGLFIFAASGTPQVQDVFSVLFASAADRLWSSATLSGFNGVQALALPGEAFGARFVYGTPVAVGVPDRGAAVVLLAGALGCLGLVASGIRRAESMPAAV